MTYFSLIFNDFFIILKIDFGVENLINYFLTLKSFFLLTDPLILPLNMYNILPLNNSKLLYPNAILFITFILLFIPSVYPLLYLSSINEFNIYFFHLDIVPTDSTNSGMFFSIHLLIYLVICFSTSIWL